MKLPSKPLVLAVLNACLLVCAGCESQDDEGAAASASAGSGGAAAGSAGAGGLGGVSGGMAASAGVGASAAAGGSSGSAGGAGAAGSGGGAAGSAGGAAGNAGASADGGIDASVEDDASTPEDRCESALFCETFEAYSAGSPPGGSWQPRTSNGAVSVVDDQKYGGEKSVRFTTNASDNGKTAFIRLADADVFPVAGNAYYGRMMFRLESAPETAVHWTFIQSSGVVPGESYHAIYRYGGQHPVKEGDSFVGTQLMANYETPDSYGGNGPSSDCWLHADQKIAPVGRWVCAEWQFDGPNDTMRFWLDGEPLDDLTMSGAGQGCVHQPASFAWTAPTFETLDLGWESYQSDAARTLYIDDVVIDTQRIGCSTP